MSRLAPATYLDHLRSETARFREVLADCDPSTPVPSCPGWSADDLLWHLAGVHRFWTGILRERPSPPPGDHEEQPRPDYHTAVLAGLDEWSPRLAAALQEADPAEEAWTWSDDHTVGFILRRQAHEALIHRLDAELTVGRVTPLDPRLAADGVLEALEVMYGGCPPWGVFTPGEGLLRLDCTDTGDAFWVRLGTFDGTDPETGTTYAAEADLHVVPGGDEEPDVVVDGPAGALDAWLWHRGDDADLSVAGDREVLDRFRTVVSAPIA